MAPHGSVAVVPLITTRSSGGVTMDVRSEKTRVATQTKPRACASLPRGSGLPAWRRKLPDSSSLGKTHVNGSTQRRRGGGESSRRSQKPSLGPLGSPPGPQTLRKRREGSVPRTRPSRSAGSEPRLPPRTRAVQLPPALRPAPRSRRLLPFQLLLATAAWGSRGLHSLLPGADTAPQERNGWPGATRLVRSGAGCLSAQASGHTALHDRHVAWLPTAPL